MSGFCNLEIPANGVDVRVTMYYRYNSGYKQFLVDMNLDMCTYRSKTNAAKIFDLLRGPLEKYGSNIYQGCPYSGNMTLNKLPLDGDLFPSIFIPAGDYYIHYNVTLDRGLRNVLDARFYFSIAAGRTIEDDRMG